MSSKTPSIRIIDNKEIDNNTDDIDKEANKQNKQINDS